MDADLDLEAAVDPGTGGAPATVMYNPFEPGFSDDPYAQYAAIRADGRVHHNPLGLRVLSHYEDCFELLRLGGTSVDERNATNVVAPPLPDDLVDRQAERSRSILSLDPPDHTRLRRLVSSAFTVRRIERLRERARVLVAELLDDIAADTPPGEPVDLLARFAFPLPFVVISELLGMPDGDRDQLRAWSHEMTRSLEPFNDDPTLRRIVAAADQMFAHVDDAIEWKRRNPADDLLSGMIAAEEDGERLSPVELRDQVVLLYLAGHETTVNLIGNGTLALLRHRAQLERLVADPSLDANAVDELLRYDSPVQVSRRIAHDRHRDRRRADRRRRAGPHPAGLVEPRRGQVGPDRRRPRPRPRGRGRAPVVRQRHPPLPRIRAGAPRGRRGRPRPRPTLSGHGVGHRRPRVERPDRAARARQPARRAGGLSQALRPGGSG